MTQQPFLLPWVRVLLDPLHHLDHLGARGVPGGEAGTPARATDAAADRAGGMVELDSRGFLVKDHEPAIEQLRHVRR